MADFSKIQGFSEYNIHANRFYFPSRNHASPAAGRLLPVHRDCQGFSERTASATGHGHKE